MKQLLESLFRLDDRIIEFLNWHAHLLHRFSIGILFIWFGLLKPYGLKTTSSILAHTIYWGTPERMVVFLGWWEVAIGVCLMIRPLVRVALVLLVIRLPGIILAFILKPEVCFVSFPLAPTPEGQYLIKDLCVFFATIAIAASLREPSLPARRH